MCPEKCWHINIVVHCRSDTQLKIVKRQIRQRFTQCGLELCQEKTKIVYCKDSSRGGRYPNQSFDFLSYTFRPRSARDKNGKFFISFSPAVSRKALKAMRAKLKGHPLIKAGYSQSVAELATAINPIIQGWITYYGKFRKSALSAIDSYINEKLLRVGRGGNSNRYSAGNGAPANGCGSYIGNIRHYLLTGEFGVGWLNNKSRMNREVHVRFCEQLKGAVPFG